MPEGFRAVVVNNAGSALGLLERDKGHVYAGICLDHDLQQQTKTTADCKLSGSTVVDSIVRNISPDVPILIHSMNPGPAPLMAQKLENAGFYINRVPMCDLNSVAFQCWLDEVKEIWEDFSAEL